MIKGFEVTDECKKNVKTFEFVVVSKNTSRVLCSARDRKLVCRHTCFSCRSATLLGPRGYVSLLRPISATG